ncbi:MAG TPA: hypothetical protein VHX38_26540 [Pseudonocardiaceae bacterium]|jgi:hypothetical protein|nr:hypothetical protein [Pseudonocardiaceae bacterium]
MAAHQTPTHQKSSGSGFAVQGPALTAYTSTAGRVATELDGFAKRELGTASTLPAEALSPLAHTSGFTPALLHFCQRVTDTAHELGAAVHDITSTLHSVRDNYHATEQTVAKHLSHPGKPKQVTA